MKNLFKLLSVVFLSCLSNFVLYGQNQNLFVIGSSITQFGKGPDWASISSGTGHNLAIKSDGSLWSWSVGGSDTVQIGSDTNWTSISSGANHYLGIKSNGTLWAGGYNGYGQLGDGTTTNRNWNSPVQIGTGTDWVNISCGHSHTLAIKNDSSLWAWGYNGYGQLGDGTTTDRYSPVKIGTGEDWASVSCGTYHSFAIKSDGTLWSWGSNYQGQLGDGTTTDRYSPVKIGTGMSSVFGGYLHSLAIKSDGSLWAWGDNNYGQLGDSTTTDRYSPIQIGTGTEWAIVACGTAISFAIKGDGTLWGWGVQFGSNFGYSPVQIGTGIKWTSVASSFYGTIALGSYIPNCSITVTPSDNTYTGGVATNIYLGYGPQSATLNAAATGGTGFTYSWSPSTYLSSTTSKNPVFSPTSAGNYTYTVTVTNSNNSTTTCTVSFCVKDIRVSGTGGKKVYLCHVPSGNTSKAETLSISTNAVSAHLANHSGDALGECGSKSNNTKRSSGLQLADDNTVLEITCSPNPFTGSFKLYYNSPSSEKASILIYDMTGKLIEETYLSGYSNQIESGKDLSAGIYTVTFTQGSLVRLFKIIKTN